MAKRALDFPIACVAASLLAQACVQYYPAPSGAAPPPYPPPYAGGPTSSPPQPPGEVSPSGLDALLMPIALYPDPLLALILPACTVPGDLAAAQAYLVQYGDMSRIDTQPWDPSVRGLAHYPSVVAWLCENPAWSQAVGSAFLGSPQEVTRSIQYLRSLALASGTLVPTSQEQVYSDRGQIYIVPGQPNAIYVPAYDSDAVFAAEPYIAVGATLLEFGAPLPIGPWLSYGFDWNDGNLWAGGWAVWHGGGTWHTPRFVAAAQAPGAHPWHPSQKIVAPAPALRISPAPAALKPRPMPTAPRAAPRPAIPSPSSGPVEPARALPPRGQPPSAARPVPVPAASAAPKAAPAAHSEAKHAAAEAPAKDAADPKNH